MGQTIIEINGIKYDAITGEIVQSSVMHNSPVRPTNIDGIHRHQNIPTVMQTTPALAPKKPEIKHTPQRLMHDVTTTKRHAQQKSITLMRQTVKKPQLANEKAHEQVKTTQATPSQHNYLNAISSPDRIQRAQQTPKHAAVSRFSVAPIRKIEPTLQHMVVAKEQNVQAEQPTYAPPLNYKTPQPQTFVDSQLSKALSGEQDSPFKKPKLHKRITKKISEKKLLSVGASIATLALIAGFVVLQNLPTISLAVASKNAGISMNIPKGVPSNFKILPQIEYAKDQITVSFKSRTDSREFAITQIKNETETQESLEYALKNNKQNIANGGIQTYETNGIKIFMPGPGRAEWIDADMRYSISGNSGLSSEQLATIVASL